MVSKHSFEDRVWIRLIVLQHEKMLFSAGGAKCILLAGTQELPVEIGDILCFRHRHPVIAPEVSGFSFNAALLVRLGRRAKLRCEPPVRRKATKRAVCSRRDPHRIFFTAESAQLR